jgi:hypothetical protein
LCILKGEITLTLNEAEEQKAIKRLEAMIEAFHCGELTCLTGNKLDVDYSHISDDAVYASK